MTPDLLQRGPNLPARGLAPAATRPRPSGTQSCPSRLRSGREPPRPCPQRCDQEPHAPPAWPPCPTDPDPTQRGLDLRARDPGHAPRERALPEPEPESPATGPGPDQTRPGSRCTRPWSRCVGPWPTRGRSRVPFRKLPMTLAKVPPFRNRRAFSFAVGRLAFTALPPRCNHSDGSIPTGSPSRCVCPRHHRVGSGFGAAQIRTTLPSSGNPADPISAAPKKRPCARARGSTRAAKGAVARNEPPRRLARIGARRPRAPGSLREVPAPTKKNPARPRRRRSPRLRRGSATVGIRIPPRRIGLSRLVYSLTPRLEESLAQVLLA